MPQLLPKWARNGAATTEENNHCHDTENGFNTSISEEGVGDMTGTQQLMKQCCHVIDKGFNASVSKAALPWQGQEDGLVATTTDETLSPRHRQGVQYFRE